MRVHLRLFAFVALALVATALYTTRVRHTMVDFIVVRQAAERGLQAAPLYRSEDGHYQFKYFPLFALVMAPFGALDEEVAKALWFVILLALLAALLRGSVTALPDRRLPRRTLLWITIVLMAKFYAHELVLGQANLPLGVLLVTVLIAVQHNRPVAAGGFAGLAVFIKPYALILFPWLLVTQGWRAAAMGTAVVVAGLLLPAAVYGWTGNVDLLGAWLRTVSTSTAPNLLNNDNVSIAAMWAKWLGPGALASGLTWLTLAGLAMMVLAAWRRRQAVSAPDYLECALLMLLIPLVSPQGWDYVLLLATPAIVCLVDRWRELTRPWQYGLGAALALMCLTTFDVMGRALYGRFMALSIVTVCALVLGAGLVHARVCRLA